MKNMPGRMPGVSSTLTLLVVVAASLMAVWAGCWGGVATGTGLAPAVSLVVVGGTDRDHANPSAPSVLSLARGGDDSATLTVNTTLPLSLGEIRSALWETPEGYHALLVALGDDHVRVGAWLELSASAGTRAAHDSPLHAASAVRLGPVSRGGGAVGRARQREVHMHHRPGVTPIVAVTHKVQRVTAVSSTVLVVDEENRVSGVPFCSGLVVHQRTVFTATSDPGVIRLQAWVTVIFDKPNMMAGRIKRSTVAECVAEKEFMVKYLTRSKPARGGRSRRGARRERDVDV